MEVNQTYGGDIGILRWVLLICGFLIVLNDLNSMSQSIFMYRQISDENKPGILHQIQFTIYCIVRLFFVYYSFIIILEFSTNAKYFRQPMDLCMNFAALAFLLDLDDIVCSANYFKILKIKFYLFEEEQYPLRDIEAIGSFGQIFLPKSSQHKNKCCSFCGLSILILVAGLIFTMPL